VVYVFENKQASFVKPVLIILINWSLGCDYPYAVNFLTYSDALTWSYGESCFVWKLVIT